MCRQSAVWSISLESSLAVCEAEEHVVLLVMVPVWWAACELTQLAVLTVGSSLAVGQSTVAFELVLLVLLVARGGSLLLWIRCETKGIGRALYICNHVIQLALLVSLMLYLSLLCTGIGATLTSHVIRKFCMPPSSCALGCCTRPVCC